MEKPVTSFFLMDFVLLVVMVAFILSVFRFSGFFFLLELIVLLVFLGLLIIGMIGAYANTKNGWTIIAATLILIALDVFFIFIFSGNFGYSDFIALVGSLVGMIIALIGLTSAQNSSDPYDGEYYPTEKAASKQDVKKEVKHEVKKEVKSEVQKESEEIKKELREGLHEIKQELKENLEEEKVEKSFVPGKYIASRKANKFHSPKCDWANRIKRGNEIWFQSKEEAQAQGYEADECV